MVIAIAFADQLARLESTSGEAADFLRLLASKPRLLCLCQLLAHDEMDGPSLGRATGLRPSALTRHLARLEAEGIVASRPDGASLHYRIADPRAVRLLTILKDVLCPPAADRPGP